MKRRNYVGLATSGHDPALAIVGGDGEVRFAEGAERYLQNKRAWRAPPDDTHRAAGLIAAHCDAGAELVLATTWTERFALREDTLNRIRRMAEPLAPILDPILNKTLGPDGSWMRAYWSVFRQMMNAGYNGSAGLGIALDSVIREPSEAHPIVRHSHVHHLTHAATACYTSTFDKAACLVIDGGGEQGSLAYYGFEDGVLRPLNIGKRSAMASLGALYSMVCWACGFDPFGGEEWKVMGLAAYGKRDEGLLRLLRKIVGFRNGGLTTPENWAAVKELLDLRDTTRPPLESADLAYTAQEHFSELVFEIARHIRRETGYESLALGGGCALNSACNGRIAASSGFKNVHVFSAPADDGNALGAAWLSFFEDNPEKRRRFRRPEVHSAYLGSTMSESSLARLERYSSLLRVDCPEAALFSTVAALLAKGEIVGWVQGRAEFGPRALGNRSILADPRSASVKDRLNAHVKFREEFRPFAPSILHEHGAEYFEDYQETPYMERALLFKSDKRALVPGVVHVDNTGRLQTVKREWNERYYDLISAFRDLTGIPIVLNTSFNVMGKPIIHSVEDAVSVFLTSGMDVLVIGDRIYRKNAGLH